MSDTPETDKQAVGAIGFYSCATVPADLARRLERERDEARIQYRSTLALAEALAKTQIELKVERDEARAQRKEAVEAICDFVNGQVWPAETWGNARYLRRLFEIAQEESCK